ncbi:MAG: HD domain-containing protein [Thermoplasmatales archaeon]|nr:HD domain-containing protein [Thermoplasmatales archaeon]
MGKRRTIHDPIHGGITLDGVFLELMDRHEMQRLRSIRQLGMGSYVFPGANHTRFEHSLGVYHLSKRMAHALGLDETDTTEVAAAALLHDVCHPPFSHTTEDLLEGVLGSDHMESAVKLINGEIEHCRERDMDILGDVPPISKVLSDAGISPERVCELIALPKSRRDGQGSILDVGADRQAFFKTKDYAHQIIHGPVDADQMDYLMRDAHYTGVTLGAVDIERLMSQMCVGNNRLVLRKGGIYAAEGLMVSRALMYSSVYYHKTVRIAELMLTKAANMSGLDFSDIHLMDDCEFMARLVRCESPAASRLVRSLMHRRFYKNAYVRYSVDMDENELAQFVKYSDKANKAALEAEIAARAGVEEHAVVVDIPSKGALLSAARVGKTDVSIIDDDGRIKSITRYSPLAKSLQNRDVFDWVISVSAEARHRAEVAEAAAKVLALDDADGG